MATVYPAEDVALSGGGRDVLALLAHLLVVASGIWLVGLALGVAMAPGSVRRLLERFASSARAHYAEQTLRFIAGLAFIVFASDMRFPQLFRVFGWALAVSAAVLFLVPWIWHHRFGEWAIPLATGNLRLFGAGTLALGAFILYAAF